MSKYIDTAQQPDIGHTGLSGAWQRFLSRLRHVVAPSWPWALVAIIAGGTWALPLLQKVIEPYGYMAWLYRGFAPAVFTSIIFMVALAIAMGCGSVSKIAERPGRLALLLIVGSAIGALGTWIIDLGVLNVRTLPLPARLMDWWLTNLVFGGAFGYAAILNIRRVENHAALLGLLGRRSVLSRQVAQSNLLKARAQIDPGMVARILKNLRSQYKSGPNDSAELLDHLIAYLRLAMSRERGSELTVATELATIRAYATLRQCETGRPIRLQIKVPESMQQQVLPAPLFLIVKLVLDEVDDTGMDPITLCIELDERGANIVFDAGIAPLTKTSFGVLCERMRELPGLGGSLDILHHLLDSGVNRYVVKTSHE